MKETLVLKNFIAEELINKEINPCVSFDKDF